MISTGIVIGRNHGLRDCQVDLPFLLLSQPFLLFPLHRLQHLQTHRSLLPRTPPEPPPGGRWTQSPSLTQSQRSRDLVVRCDHRSVAGSLQTLLDPPRDAGEGREGGVGYQRRRPRCTSVQMGLLRVYLRELAQLQTLYHVQCSQTTAPQTLASGRRRWGSWGCW